MSQIPANRCTGVENGRKIAFAHPSCAGRAGLVTVNGKTNLAYLQNKAGGKPPAVGTDIQVDGGTFKVVEVKLSKAPPMYRLALEPA